MVIGFDRDISNRIVSSVVSIKEFGTGSIPASKEKENLDDYPQVLKYADIDFTAKVAMGENHMPVIVEENETPEETSGEATETTGNNGEGGGDNDATEADSSATEATYDTITLDLANESYTINEDFSISYAVDAKTLTRKVKAMNVIPDEDCLAMAMVLVWEKKIADQIEKLVAKSRVHMNGFADTIVEVTI